MSANTASGVRVRMYRQGLGDCFLISFPREGGGRFHLMIDFGVLLGTANAEERMKKVARSIALETGGSADGKMKGKVDVLVATHEHWDHVSGFVQARDEITGLIDVGEVWMAWTEDPNHPLANELRQDRKRKVAHLHAAAARLRGDTAMGDAAQGIEGLLGFFGARAEGGSTADAMKSLSERPESRVVYRKPGEPVFTLPGVEGVRVYVLGPPEDRKLIKKSDPTKRGREVYEFASALSLADTFFAGVALGLDDEGKGALAGAEMDPDAADLAFPFDRRYRIETEAARKLRVRKKGGGSCHFFREFYGFDAAGQGEGGDDGESPAWRRIDSDWLGVAQDLAMALDSDTNNTSLALALELGEGGPVLLFPGDAQVGNWLSWQSLSWPADPKRPDGAKITTDDLLRRTILYKVGHHGSHNATLREQGLEKMTSPQLVALIPVDQEMARKKKWAMPFGSLYERLKARTRGRLIRVDQGRLPFDEAAKYGLTRAEWEEFERRTPADPDGEALWIEYHLGG
ncbi:MAG TPA: hypothetical protein VFJ16_03425 [Longimicrobium sp.]|nr:hypothetical protein [Longimicrobium sp.]